MKWSKWSPAQFDDILERVERKIVLDDAEIYDCVGVRWYGLGTFIRESKLGMDIRRKNQWTIKEGDVVYNKLFAWKGAFAIADADVDGCIVSDKFPTYKLDEGRVDPRYLRYYFRTEFIAQQAQDFSKGAAAISKLTLNPPDFWKLTIPLPPLDEQRRIVACIEELAALIEEARGLRQRATKETRILITAALCQVFSPDFEVARPLSQIAKEGGEQVSASDHSGEIYLSLGDIEANTGTILQKRSASAAGVHGSAVRFNANSVLFSKLRPYLNKVVVPTFSGIGTTELVVLEPDSDILEREFFAWFLRSPKVVGKLVQHSTGTKMPRANLKVFRSLMVPIPPLAEQRRIVAYLDNLQAQVDELTALQDATQAELDALLPSVLDRAFRGGL